MEDPPKNIYTVCLEPARDFCMRLSSAPPRLPPRSTSRGRAGVASVVHLQCNSLRPEILPPKLLSCIHPFPGIFVGGSLCPRPKKGSSHSNSHLTDGDPEDGEATVGPRGCSATTGGRREPSFLELCKSFSSSPPGMLITFPSI